MWNSASIWRFPSEYNISFSEQKRRCQSHPLLNNQSINKFLFVWSTCCILCHQGFPKVGRKLLPPFILKGPWGLQSSRDVWSWHPLSKSQPHSSIVVQFWVTHPLNLSCVASPFTFRFLRGFHGFPIFFQSTFRSLQYFRAFSELNCTYCGGIGMNHSTLSEHKLNYCTTIA